MLTLPVYMLVRRTDSRPVVVGEGTACVVLLFTQQTLAERMVQLMPEQQAVVSEMRSAQQLLSWLELVYETCPEAWWDAQLSTTGWEFADREKIEHLHQRVETQAQSEYFSPRF